MLYSDPENRPFHFRQPSAVHKTRWMSKILCSIKIIQLEEQICLSPAETITTAVQQTKLRSFVNFMTIAMPLSSEKPKFLIEVTATKRLGDLVTVDSWHIFRLLEMDVNFLYDDAENWAVHPSFLSSKMETIFNFVNDSAERGGKLI